MVPTGGVLNGCKNITVCNANASSPEEANFHNFMFLHIQMPPPAQCHPGRMPTLPPSHRHWVVSVNQSINQKRFVCSGAKQKTVSGTLCAINSVHAVGNGRMNSVDFNTIGLYILSVCLSVCTTDSFSVSRLFSTSGDPSIRSFCEKLRQRQSPSSNEQGSWVQVV